jgi:twitching motility protein PilJ
MSRKFNIFGGFRSSPLLSVLIIMLVVAVGSVAFAVVKIQSSNNEIESYLKMVDDMRTTMYRTVDDVRLSMDGSDLNFESLGESIIDIDQIWGEMKGPQSRLATLMPDQMRTLEDLWEQRIKVNSNTILESREPVLLVQDVGSRLAQTIPQLQESYDAVVEQMVSSGAASAQVEQARAQSWRAERIARNVERLVAGGADAEEAAELFRADAVEFGEVLEGMRNGNAELGIDRVANPDIQSTLEDAAGMFKFVSESADNIASAKDALISSQQSEDNIVNMDVPALLQELTALAKSIGDLRGQNRWTNLFYLSSGLTGLILIFIAILQIRGSAKRLQVQERENDRNQNAIMRLLDEIADLADGDLTATATVTEDFTGAIADSINVTIDQLRVLVSRISDTAVRVSAAAQETQNTALQLAEASDHQAQEIAGASAAVNEMAVTIDQVSANAAESAAVAERSVSIANKGAEVVQNTIQGMDNIREQIQETSKRIKRLGESSQEIGDIVSLINDIADQTNILALNAAIQASMAGDAGRGFAVVADEVQRLAERSSAATKQIEALVKTIQTDTNEAVASMEQTTAEVVRGARLAQDAGVALEEIENVSTTLAELIQNISNAARQQASSAGHISNTMNIIQEITSQTSAGTNTTARAIGHLAEMAEDLRKSVQNFKLPEEAAGYADMLSENESMGMA